MTIKINPTYGSIQLVVDLCEPWINIWSGDEWGESMNALMDACRTGHGFSEEDCALFASKLFENLEAQKEWVWSEGHAYGFMDNIGSAQAQCRSVKKHWEEETWNTAPIKETLDTIPDWIFG